MSTNKLEKYLTEAKLGGVSNQAIVDTVNGMLNQIQEIITDIEDQLEEVSEERFGQEAIGHLNRMYNELVKTRVSLKGGKGRW